MQQISPSAWQIDDYSMWGNLMPAIAQGIKLGSMPQHLQQESQKAALQNALSKIALQYAPQDAQADLNYKNAQSQYLQGQAATQQQSLDNPLLGQPGPAGQIGALDWLIKNPPASSSQAPQLQTYNDMVKSLKDAISAQTNQRNTMSDYYGAKTDTLSWNSLPVDQKKSLLAQAGGMGIDPVDAQSQFISGKTIADLAKERGFDPGNLPTPVYPATQTDITRIHQRGSALQEINALEQRLTGAMAPYSNRFNGYSPKQIGEALTNENPDSQAQFLAAQALMPELAAARVKALNGQVGIEAIREITNASMGNIKTFQSLVRPEVYTQANKYVDQWLNEAAGKANSYGLQVGQLPGQGNQSPMNPGVTQAISNQLSGGQASSLQIDPKLLTPENLEYTAKRKGISVDQLKKRLGIS